MASRDTAIIWVGAAVAGLLVVGGLAAVAVGGSGHESHAHAAHLTTAPARATATATTTATVTALRDETDNLTVSVPAGWQSPSLAPGSYADMIRSFVARNPQFAPIVSQRLTKSTTTVGLFAVDPRSHTTLVVESVAATPNAVAGPVTDGVLPIELIDQYEKLGIQVFNTERVELPVGPALHAALGLVVAGKDLIASQYFIDEGARVVTITIEGPDGPENLAVHDRIARSARR